MPSQITYYGISAYDYATGNITPDMTWTDKIASNGNWVDAFLNLDNIYAIAFAAHSSNADKWNTMVRGQFRFDCSSIPDDATVISATLYLYGYRKQDPNNWTPNINIYSSDGSFEGKGSTAFSTAISYASFSITGYNEFPFNAAGIASISKTTTTWFCTRNANYEVAGTSPTWAGGGSTDINVWTIDAADINKRPKLVIIYSIGGNITNNTIVTGLRHIYSKGGGNGNTARDDLEITFGGYSTAEDILAPEIMKIVEEATIPQIPKPFKFGGGESGGGGATRKWESDGSGATGKW